jgi:hypothetical protein
MILEILPILNNNKIIWGVTMLLLNMGSKYVMADLGKIHEKVLTNEIAKKIIIFSMFFVATRDFLTAFILSVFYVLLIDGVLHENRNFSLITKPSDVNGKLITEDEYRKAQDTIMSYESQQKQTSVNTNLYESYLSNIYHLRQT